MVKQERDNDILEAAHLQEAPPAAGQFRDFMRLITRHIRPYLPILAVLGVINMVPGCLMAFRPLVLAPVLGKVLSEEVEPAGRLSEVTLDNVGASLQAWIGQMDAGTGSLFALTALIYALLTMVAALVMAAVHSASLAVRLRLYRDMIAALHHHLLRLNLGFFRRSQTGELVSRFVNDLNMVSNSIDAIAMGMIERGMLIAVGTLILLRTDAKLTMIIVLLGSFHFVVTHFLGKWVRSRARAAFASRASFSAALVESFQSIFVIKCFASEPYAEKRVSKVVDRMRRILFRFNFCTHVEEPIRVLTDGVLVAAILLLCEHALSSGRLSLQGMILFFYMASQLVLPMSQMGRLLVRFKSMQGGASRIVGILGMQPEVVDGILPAPPFTRELSLQSVRFRHGDQPVLDNVSLNIRKGETIAVVGPSGGGKTTLLNLILRLYDPNEGGVYMDGVDIRRFTGVSYRSLFGVVPQEAFLFNDTIRENILFGRSFDSERFEHASRIARLEDMMDSMPDGWDTLVGDRGECVSGGQRQRIALARAVYGMPALLVLDEATSALDAESEEAIQSAMSVALETMTGIVVAHRLATVVKADRIVVLDAGRIHAVGSHAQLLASNPLYKRLYELQFGGNGIVR